MITSLSILMVKINRLDMSFTGECIVILGWGLVAAEDTMDVLMHLVLGEHFIITIIIISLFNIYK